MKRNRTANTAATRAWGRARRAAAQVKPVAAQAKPVAASTQAAARRGVQSTRAWAAPRVERTGRVLQHSIAPKVSAQLSSAARRLDPAKPRHWRRRTLAGVSVLTAAAGAAVAVVRGRRKPDDTSSAAEADVDKVTPRESGDGKAKSGTGAKLK